jgi:hypothetical protein
LLLIGVSLCEVLELVDNFPTSPSSLKMDFACIFYCVFEFGGFTGSFLRDLLTSPCLVFYILLLIGLYGLHWIDLSLSFSKIPSLLKSESEHKSFHHFCLASFSVGASPVCTRIFTKEPVSTQRYQDFYQGAGFNPTSPACTPGDPA